MIKKEFLEKMKQDLQVENDMTLNALLEVFENVLSGFDSNIEIEESKSIKDCYSKMEQEASKNKIGNSYCFTPKMTEDFVLDYLNLKKQTAEVRLEDFF